MTNRFDRLWDAVHKEIPGARILNKKNSAFMRVTFAVLTFLVKVFTLGQGKADWSGYTTTIWRTMYVPEDFFYWSDEDKYRLLRHELVHLRQFRRWPMSFLDPYLWRVNALIMSFCYIFVFPVILTFRAKFERAGYTQSMLSWYEIHGFSTRYRVQKAMQMGVTFGGSPYLFMWRTTPAKIWAYDTMDAIANGDITNDKDNVDTWT